MSTLLSGSSTTDDWGSPTLRQFAIDVRAGLSKPAQKEIHSKYLYDELGSALFDAITFLPEYGLTKADARLLRTYAAQIVQALERRTVVIELGSGNGSKTRHILNALRVRQPDLVYYPIDLSASALARCERELADVATIRPVMRAYLDGLEYAASERRPGERLLILFLGSNIGNFERPRAEAFLANLRALVQPGDALLMGADLVKLREQMLLAYDDPTGVTASFNLNLLGRINRELGGNFNLRSFEHVAIYSNLERRIEMHLRSTTEQTVHISEADFSVHLSAGETIWTESSHKYMISELPPMAEQAGFRIYDQWVDREWPFVESLWIAI